MITGGAEETRGVGYLIRPNKFALKEDISREYKQKGFNSVSVPVLMSQPQFTVLCHPLL